MFLCIVCLCPPQFMGRLKEFILEDMKTVKMGDVEDFGNFINAVIDEPVFSKITKYIEFIKDSNETEIICGGNYDNNKGYFIEPTIAVTNNPTFAIRGVLTS